MSVNRFISEYVLMYKKIIFSNFFSVCLRACNFVAARLAAARKQREDENYNEACTYQNSDTLPYIRLGHCKRENRENRVIGT
jgi:hypothetical protein